MLSPGTPPDYEDAIIEIRSVHGIKRITNERLAEITAESWGLGKRDKRGTKKQCQEIFDRLIADKVARVV
jgi:glycerate kinase